MQERIISAHPRYDRVNHLSGRGFQPHMSIAKFSDKVRTRAHARTSLIGGGALEVPHVWSETLAL
jgi:hypothetical protein